jgi:hypothetical protein
MMGYFACRAAPLGPIGPDAVTAAFYGFHPSRSQRALPDAWQFAPPEKALAARLAGADGALRRVLGATIDTAAVTEAADLAWAAAQAASTPGRILGAANQALPRPDAPHLALWQAATTLREHRGDGHHAVLVAAGIGPVQAHQLKMAAGEADSASLRVSRDWPDEAWAAATDELTARGWLDAEGRLTAAGASARAEIEDRTDEAASSPWQALGTDRTQRLAELLTPWARAVIDSGAVPLPNAVGAADPT